MEKLHPALAHEITLSLSLAFRNLSRVSRAIINFSDRERAENYVTSSFIFLFSRHAILACCALQLGSFGSVRVYNEESSGPKSR